MISDELLPCPFCGGDPIVFVRAAPKLWSFTCRNCDAGPSGSLSRTQAIAAWNRRTALAAKPGMVSEEPTMWAEVVENYEGDGVEWSCHAISDMDSEERPLLELAANTFEVGTIVKIFEPTPTKSEKEEGV